MPESGLARIHEPGTGAFLKLISPGRLFLKIICSQLHRITFWSRFDEDKRDDISQFSRTVNACGCSRKGLVAPDPEPVPEPGVAIVSDEYATASGATIDMAIVNEKGALEPLPPPPPTYEASLKQAENATASGAAIDMAIVNEKGALEPLPPPQPTYEASLKQAENAEQSPSGAEAAGERPKLPLWKTIVFFVCGIENMDDNKNTSQEAEPVPVLLALIRETPTQKLIGFTNMFVIALIALGLYIFFF